MNKVESSCVDVDRARRQPFCVRSCPEQAVTGSARGGRGMRCRVGPRKSRNIFCDWHCCRVARLAAVNPTITGGGRERKEWPRATFSSVMHSSHAQRNLEQYRAVIENVAVSHWFSIQLGSIFRAKEGGAPNRAQPAVLRISTAHERSLSPFSSEHPPAG